MTTIRRMCLQEEEEKAPLISSWAPIISTNISPAHVFADYPVTASSGGKWNYIVCAECPKENMY